MQRGSGNTIKNSYKRRSPLREPITAILSAISMAAGAVNKSNAASKAKGTAKSTKGIKMAGIAKGSGMDKAKAAVAPMGS
jgi:hypothetical protein